MFKQKIKRVTAFILTICMVSTLPDYSMMVYAAEGDPSVSLAREDVIVCEDANRQTDSIQNTETIAITASNVPTGAVLDVLDAADGFSYDASLVDASVNGTNLIITGKSKGTTTVSVGLVDENDGTFIAGTNASILVRVARDITSSSISVSYPEGSVVYTGSEVVPNFTITDGGTVLAKSTNYNINYSNISKTAGGYYDRKSAGTQKIKILGAANGNYYGEYIAEYKIERRSIADAITAAGADAVKWYNTEDDSPADGILAYTGNYIKPVTSSEGEEAQYFVVSDLIGGVATALTYGTDYEIDATKPYANNKYVGTARVNIVGHGNYQGEAQISFRIMKDFAGTDRDQNIAVTFDKTTIIYDGAEHKQEPVIRDGDDANNKLVKDRDYTISFTTAGGDYTSAGVKEVTITGIEAANFKGTYVKTYEILAKDINDCIVGGADLVLPQQITGFATVDGLEITKDGKHDETGAKALIEDTDYTLTITPGVGRKATVKVEGIGNYTGTFEQEVTTGEDISTFQVTMDAEYEYSVNGVSPENVEVSKGAITLVKGVDYELTYYNNKTVAAGNAVTPENGPYVKIQGIGNYAGKLVKEFSIVKKQIASAGVIASDMDYHINTSKVSPYNIEGAEVETTLTQDSVELVKGTDYVVTSRYQNFLEGADLNDAIAGQKIGEVEVTVAGYGNYSGSFSKIYPVVKSSFSSAEQNKLSVSMKLTTLNYTGNAIVPDPNAAQSSDVKLTVKQGDTVLTLGSDYEIAFKDNNGYLYKKNGTSYTNEVLGEYDLTGVGTKNCVIQGKGKYTGTYEFTYKIGAIDIINGSFTIADKVYTGNAVTLEAADFTTAVYDSTSLVYGQDYQIVAGSYFNNTDYGRGTASVTLQGIGNYSGTQTVTFHIKKALSSDDIEYVYELVETYTGNQIKPSVIVKDATRGTLVKDVDYTLSYGENKNVGTGTITVTAMGSAYTGSKVLSFGIGKYSIENVSVAAVPAQEYTGGQIRPSVTLTYDGVTLSNTNDYTITGYENNINAGTATIIVKAKEGSNYTGEKRIEFTIEPKNIATAYSLNNIIVSHHDFTAVYNGKAQRPNNGNIDVVDVQNSKTLYINDDFTVSFENNINAGSASSENGPKLVVTGKGNYTGSIKVGFDITKYPISAADSVKIVAAQGPFVYNGAEQKPHITVSLKNGTVLKETTGEETGDYTVSYSSNVNAGTAGYTVTFGSNFTGSTVKSGNFTINPADITDAEIVGATIKKVGATEYIILPNQGWVDDPVNGVIPEITLKISGRVVDSSEYTITAGANFNENSKNVNAANVHLNKGGDYPYADITAAVDGNFTGTVTVYYNIRPSVKYLGWKSNVSNITFDTKEKTPLVNVVRASNENEVLEKDVDYTLTYGNNINAKKANTTTPMNGPYVIVQGIGEYGGTVVVPFTINPIELPQNLDGLDSNYYKVLGKNIEFVGNSSIDATAMFNTRVLYYPNGDASRNSTTSEYYDLYENGDMGPAIVNFNDTVAPTSIKATFRGEGYIEGRPETYPDGVNFVKKGSSSYELTLSVGKRSLGEQSAYAEYIKIASLPEISYSESGTDMKSMIKIYDIYRNASGAYDATNTQSNRYKLVYGTDYTLTGNYEEQVIGTNRIYIQGAGNYEGVILIEFNVKSTLAAATVRATVVTYTGDEIDPNERVVVNGKTLVRDVDYTLSVIDNSTGSPVDLGTTAINAGTYNLKIVGIGDYDENGAQTAPIGTWVISPKNISNRDVTVRNILDSYSFKDNTPQLPVPVVEYNGKRLRVDLDYTLEYRVIEGSADFVKRGRYEVKIAGKGNFTGSYSKGYEVGDNFVESGNGADNIVISNEVPHFTFTGENLSSLVSFEVKKADGTVLTEGTNYIIQVINVNGDAPINVGEYNVNISGIGDYKGLITRKMVIDPAAISGFELGEVDDSTFVFNGKEYKPTPALTWNGEDASEFIGRDLIYKYDNNINASSEARKATVSVEPSGNGNFTIATGEKPEQTFEIAPKNITDTTNAQIEIKVVESTSGHFYLDIEGTEPVVNVKDVERNVELKSLKETLVGADYKVSYTNNTSESSADSEGIATITGVGNYTGTRQVKFYIEKYPMRLLTVLVEGVENYETSFTGFEIKPEIKALNEKNMPLVLGEDFTVEYENNIDAGTATVKLTAVDGSRYVGTTQAEFSIAKVALTSTNISVKTIENQVPNATPIPEITLTSASGVYTLEVDKDFEVTHSGNKNVTVNNSDVATAIITGVNNFEGTVVKEFQVGEDINRDGLITSVDIERDEYEYNGNVRKPIVNVATTLTEGTQYKLIYEDNWYDVGEHVVTVAGVGDYGGSKTVPYVVKPANLAEKLKSVVAGNVTFTGDVERPILAVTSTIMMKVSEDSDAKVYESLVYDKDYTVDYVSADSVNAGTYEFTIEGKGNYIGTSATYTYTISPKNIEDESVEISLDNRRVPYSGNGDVSGVTVIDKKRNSSGASFKEGNYYYYELTAADYDAVAADPYPGETSITVSGSGNYKGSANKGSVVIYGDFANDVTIEPIPTQAFTGSAVEPALVVKIGDKTLVAGTDYVATYEDNVDGGTAKVTIKPADGVKDYWTDSEKTAEFFISRSIEDPDIASVMLAGEVEGTVPRYYYTGYAVEPEVTVTYNGAVLDPSNYTVTYENNVEAGLELATATITAKPESGYVGTVVKRFTVIQKSIAKASMTFEKEQFNYTGKAITFDDQIVVKLSGEVLEQGVDYKLVYTNNVAIGTATVKAVGMGLYRSSCSKTFTIVASTKININSCTVSWTKTVPFTGSATKPKVTVKNGTTKLVYGTDYKLTYVNNINPGIASIRITGINNYTSTKTVPYTIEVPAMGDVTVVSTSATAIKLSWTPLTNITGYLVYDQDMNKLGELTGSGGVVSTNVKGGTLYKIRVKPYVICNGVQKFGAFSPEVEAVTKPDKPAITLSTSSGKVAVTWKKVSSATGYILYRSESENGTYTKVATIRSNATLKYTDSGVTKKKTYYYKLRTYKSIDGKNYYSSYSAIKSVTVK